MAGDWFMGGFEQGRVTNDGSGGEFGNNRQSRFWLKVGSEARIIFLDDFDWTVERGGHTMPLVPFCRYEYKLDLDGDWANCVYVTCTKTAGIPCKPADLGFRRMFVGAMTILDVTPWKDRDTGEMRVTPRKKLLMAVPSALSIIETKKERKGNLKGWLYTVARHEKRSPRVGDDYEPMEKIDDLKAYLKQYGAENMNLDPYGFTAEEAEKFYRDLFAPMPIDEQQRLFSQYQITDGNGRRKSGGSSSGASAPKPEAGNPISAADDIPF